MTKINNKYSIKNITKFKMLNKNEKFTKNLIKNPN